MLDAGASADNLLGNNHGRFGWCQIPARGIRKRYAIYKSPFFVLTTSQCDHRSAGSSRLQHPKAQSSPSFEHPFSYLQTLFQGWRYSAVAQRVMFKRRYICFVESSLAWWEVIFGPLGLLDRVCQVSSYSFL